MKYICYMVHRVLVVEDESILRETLSYNLEQRQYEVLQAGDGIEALKIARQAQPDLIILDVMLPEIDGLEVCRILRQEMAVPILMLTARDEEVDKVIGLEMGADDYVTKPFSMRELMARIKALLRRDRMIRQDIEAGQNGSPVAKKNQKTLMVFEDLTIDLSRREVRRQDTVLLLKPREFDLLVFLARNRGIALSRDLILERVWGWEYVGNSRTVDVHVRWLREKIEPIPNKASRIVTVRGIGYRFEG